MTPEVYIDFINKFDVDKVALTNDEILNAIEDSLKMQGRGETEIAPLGRCLPKMTENRFPGRKFLYNCSIWLKMEAPMFVKKLNRACKNKTYRNSL